MKKCPICGNNFTPSANSQKYCSLICARKAETEKNISHIKSRNKDRQTIDKKLIDAYYHKCAICNWSIPSWKPFYKKHEPMNGLQYHHIIPVSEGGNNNSENIILLCPNCHKMAHAGLITIDELKKHTFSDEQVKKMADEYKLNILSNAPNF